MVRQSGKIPQKCQVPAHPCQFVAHPPFEQADQSRSRLPVRFVPVPEQAQIHHVIVSLQTGIGVPRQRPRQAGFNFFGQVAGWPVPQVISFPGFHCLPPVFRFGSGGADHDFVAHPVRVAGRKDGAAVLAGHQDAHPEVIRYRACLPVRPLNFDSVMSCDVFRKRAGQGSIGRGKVLRDLPGRFGNWYELLAFSSGQSPEHRFDFLAQQARYKPVQRIGIQQVYLVLRQRNGDAIFFLARPAGIPQGQLVAFQVEMFRKVLRPPWPARTVQTGHTVRYIPCSR